METRDLLLLIGLILGTPAALLAVLGIFYFVSDKRRARRSQELVDAKIFAEAIKVYKEIDAPIPEELQVRIKSENPGSDGDQSFPQRFFKSPIYKLFGNALSSIYFIGAIILLIFSGVQVTQFTVFIMVMLCLFCVFYIREFAIAIIDRNVSEESRPRSPALIAAQMKLARKQEEKRLLDKKLNASLTRLEDSVKTSKKILSGKKKPPSAEI